MNNKQRERGSKGWSRVLLVVENKKRKQII
jgi:hypothetical protein